MIHVWLMLLFIPMLQSGPLFNIWHLLRRQLLSWRLLLCQRHDAYSPSPSHFLVQNHSWHVLAICQIWPGNVYRVTQKVPPTPAPIRILVAKGCRTAPSPFQEKRGMRVGIGCRTKSPNSYKLPVLFCGFLTLNGHYPPPSPSTQVLCTAILTRFFFSHSNFVYQGTVLCHEDSCMIIGRYSIIWGYRSFSCSSPSVRPSCLVAIECYY